MPTSPLLLLHICAGTVGLLSGTLAVAVRKGSRMHRNSGVVFAVSMLNLAASGAILGYLRAQPSNILGGIMTLYMIATAWMAGRQTGRKPGVLAWAALLYALAVSIGCITNGVKVAGSPSGAVDGVPAGMDFFIGTIMLLAAAGDVRVLVRGGISGTPRIARHLWRMCFGLFIASGSFFLGRARIFPAIIRNSGALMCLTVLPLLLLIFYLIRVRFPNAYRIRSESSKPEVGFQPSSVAEINGR